MAITEADIPRILHLLNCGSVRDEHGMLRWSSNYTFLVNVLNADEKTLAVYKPQRGERPLWDFPDGTLCYREVAAYQVSTALGWRIVPPTVLREGPRGIGSVQYYIESDPEVNYFTLEERHADQLRRVALFDYITNNADRKGGHCLLDDADHVWGIDHGICFHPAPKLRTVIWDFAGQAVSEELLCDVQRLVEEVDDLSSMLRQSLDRLLAEAEVQAFQSRMRRVLNRREFPRPGPGPNYPWPPV
jgi:uncharacterized repeat protein (TIGR03843 family)